MGHLRNLKAEYCELLSRWEGGPMAMPEPNEARARKGWQEILEIMFSPEEAALASRLPLMPASPASLETLAQRVGLPPNELRTRLEPMADKGIIIDLVDPRNGETKYLLAQPFIGFFEFALMRVEDNIPKKRMAEALEAYIYGDDTFAKEVFAGETAWSRSLVHESALPQDDVPDVLDWERATAIIDEAQTISVKNCYCRHKAEHVGKRCDVPIEVCLSLNEFADFTARRGFGRFIEKAEAKDILTASRESGLVQTADNFKNRPYFICNCCGCCCDLLSAINVFGLPAVNPSGFQPVSDLNRCKGCSRCSRACPITAISMVAQRTAAKQKNELVPRIDRDRCVGCGVCVGACRNKAMRMERRSEQPYVPTDLIERTVRIALERGRLADLLFDAAATRGGRFLNGVVRALCAIPQAKKALASEQVRSRFLNYAIKNIRGSNGIPADH